MVSGKWLFRLKHIHAALFIVTILFHTSAYSKNLSFGEEDLNNRINNLQMLQKSIDNLSSRISILQKTLQSQEGIGREQDLRVRIKELSEKRDELETSFMQLVTDVDMQRAEEDKGPGFDWNQELKELLGPIIREVKKLTSRPREIEKLRNNVKIYQTQLPQTIKALENINTLLEYTKEKSLLTKLEKIRQQWQARQDELKTRMNIASRQLELELANKKTFTESAREIIRIFFKSRGRNLILSFLAFILTLISFLFLHRRLTQFSPFHQEDRSVYTRVFDVLYYSLSLLISIIALLAVLYLFGDWVLLSIAVIFLIGIGWASKQGFPVAWQQIKLMLNLGPVREGEVVIYNDLPYKIISLNLYSKLGNRYLEGGLIRLPIKDLLNYRSRPEAEKEPWFPTQKKDWVLLSDGTHGQVSVQTPEIVVLKLLGGAEVTYRTNHFLSLCPRNLSNGFRLWIPFGLDYKFRKDITHTIPGILENELNTKLPEAGFGDCLVNLKVIFKTVSISSLDLEVLADFSGGAGPDFEILQRAIAQICVDACSRNNWEIPFQQLSVHMMPLS